MKPAVFIPVNKTGYGYHATMMTKDAVLAEEVELIPYWNQIDVHEQLPHDYRKLAELGNKNRNKHWDTAFVFCHPGYLTAPAKRIIGYTTFELENIRKDSNVHSVGTASAWGQNVLSRYYERTYKIPGGVDTKTYIPNNDKFDTFTLVSVGKFERRKGHIHTLKALHNWDGEQIDFHAFWFNFFVENQIIIRTIQRMGWTLVKHTANEVIFNSGTCRLILHTWTHNKEDMIETISRSHLGVYPSAAEGWNLPLVEAMSCGLPCITTNNTAHSEYIRSDNALIVDTSKERAYDGKFFLDPNTSISWFIPTPVSIKEKIKAALDKYPQDMALKARKAVLQYDWSIINNQFRELMRINT